MDEKEIELLKDVGCPSNVIEHCLAVKEKAIKISSALKIYVETEHIRQGALYHDIGRGKTQGITHAVAGAKVAKALGLGTPVINIIERHIGSGITKSEAKRLGLPVKDYLPITPEEKIVSYVDNLTNETGHLTFNDALIRLQEIVGRDHPSIYRFLKMHEEIMSWIM